jgi:AmmeMemoRadiSam system protein A
MDLVLSEEDRSLLLATAREAIRARLSFQAPDFPEPTSPLLAPCGAFVTLKKGQDLRGCIGHITASRPLVETVRDAAAAAAFEDPRFPPLSREEWPSISIEISVLSPFRPVTDPGQIRPGTHGIMIRQGHRSGLLLPQVATEQGWDRETFLARTCRKAGLPPDAWRAPDASIEIFSALVFGEQDRGSRQA